jgi:hypothetical protein
MGSFRRLGPWVVGVGLAAPAIAGCGSGGTPANTADAGATSDATNDATNENASVDASNDAADATVLGDGAISVDASDGGSGTGEGGDGAGTQDAGGAPSSVTVSIDLTKGPARQFQPPAQPAAVSDYIYGINGLGGLVQKKTRWGLIRKGGNGFTDWNWTTNYINLGSTSCFWQGQTGGGSALAGAITQGSDTIAAAQAKGEAYLATVPILDHVSAAYDNGADGGNTCPAMGSDCNGGMASSTGVNSGNLDFVSTNPNSAAFVANAATKPGAFCTCSPSGACDAGCSVSTNPVYQDEFVNYIKVNYAAGGAPIFFSLDNEPNYWGGVHPEVWPFTGTVPCQQAAVTYDDIVSRDKVFAAAIKAVWPSAKVFGPVVSQDGIVYAHSYDKDPHYPTEVLDYYLQQMSMAAASNDAGQPLLDVLDVHYYNLQSSTASQCVQNPRMFWDPNYTQLSALATDAIDFAYPGLNNYFDTNWYPRQLIPRLMRKIAAAYPAGGTQPPPGLSFSEYNSGCEGEIAGAIAEADNLGIFGREGTFAATVAPLQSLANNYLVAAFDLYRNYDGNGAIVGDTAVNATTSDVGATSVYAFTHSSQAGAVDVVAINKTARAVTADVAIANAPSLTTATLYDIVDGSAAVVPVAGTPPAVTCAAGTCSLAYSMPSMSATTIVLR